MWQLGEEPRLRWLGWEYLRMKRMGKELAVAMETDSGWIIQLVTHGENATHHQASLWTISRHLRNPPFQLCS